MVLFYHSFIVSIKRGIGQNVPCFRCEQCGEVVYAASVVEKIDEMLEHLEKIASKIFIVNYADAA